MLSFIAVLTNTCSLHFSLFGMKMSAFARVLVALFVVVLISSASAAKFFEGKFMFFFGF